MNFVLCDDDRGFMEQLRRLLLDYCAKKDWECQCTLYSRAEDLLAANLSTVQVIFLDIDMPQTNGLDAARKIRMENADILIVFVTAFIEYAPSGYDVNAFRYLLKTELRTKLPICLDAIWEKLYIKEESIRFQGLDHIIPIRLKDILYLEGTPQRHILLHTTTFQGSLECIGKLADYDTQLSVKGFLRIQKSYLVNMQHINDIRNYFAILDNGTSLKVSVANYAAVCEKYLLWEGQSI